MTLEQAKDAVGLDELFGLSETSDQLLVLPLLTSDPVLLGTEYIVIKPPYDRGWQTIFAYPSSHNIPSYLRTNGMISFGNGWWRYEDNTNWQIMTEKQLIRFNRELAK